MVPSFGSLRAGSTAAPPVERHNVYAPAGAPPLPVWVQRDVVNDVIDWVAGLNGWLLCAAVFVLAFSESAGGVDLVVPGEVGMVVAGAAAARTDLALWILAPVAVAGAVAGDQVTFHLGRRYGLRLVDRWHWTRVRLRPKVQSAEQHFDRHGPVDVFVARWVGALRAFVPFVAGAAEMPPRRFLLWNVAGAATWATTVVALGYVFGRRIAHLVDRFSLYAGLAVVVALVSWYVFTRLRRRHAD